MRAFKIGMLAVLVVISTTNYAANNTGRDTVCQDRKEFVKNYNKTFTITPKHLVILANKYGKIDVKTGSSNQAVINVTVKANSSTQEDANKIFDRINIAFSEGPDFIKSETSIEPNKSGNWFNMSFSNNGSEYTIDYDVTMPAENNLDLSNKYGDSYIPTLNSWVKIEQKYGNFKMEKANSATISLAYGNGTIGYVSGLTANVAYGKLSSPNLKDVAITSKYSDLKFDKMENVTIQSAYDDYVINDVTNLSINSKYGDIDIGNLENAAIVSAYTDFNIKTLSNSADFKTSYGDVKIQTLKTGFGTINIDGKYTDYILGVGATSSYQIDVKTSYGDVSRPASLKHKIDSEKGSSRELVGYVGDTNAKSFIKARLSYGDLILK
jgi:hypothetical protein